MSKNKDRTFHKEEREKTGKLIKRRGAENWEITETQYLLDGKPVAPRRFGDVEISEEDGLITSDDLQFDFCPRGYFVSANGLKEIWCPTANIAIAVLKNKKNPVVEIYDSRMT